MQASQGPQSSSSVQRFYHQPQQQVEQYYATFHVLNNNVSNDSGSVGEQGFFQTQNEQFFTLDSAPAAIDSVYYDSPPAASVSSNRSAFSPQCSQSYMSDMHHSSDNTTCGSPLSGCSGVVDGNELRHVLRELENKLLGPESEIDDNYSCSFGDAVPKSSSMMKWKRMLDIAPSLDTKELLFACAEAVSDADISTAEVLMNVLEKRVSVSGDPMQRLSAYLLEGLRARILSSGSIIYKKLKCKEPTSSELLSYMQVLYHICPYFKFAYMSANVVIREAMMNENRIHIIDFQVAQGSQWMFLIKSLADRPGGPPFSLRITGVDDSQSAHARGGGLQLVGERLAKFAESCGVPFEFHAAGISGSEVELENLWIQPGEAVAVNFPYMLHHMPDESVSTMNHRDRLLRLVKSLSPKIVTLVEQESNTNTTPFLPRFRETLDYYTAMFESIDAARPRDDRQRISAEEHCVARDIVNIIACEGADRVERHEPFGKWSMRFTMAGFTPCPLSPSVGEAMRHMLQEYSPNFGIAEGHGALYLGWKNRALASSSAWR
ncbi:scarecrow-like protein 13 [Ipomoea triloba]|uniref:scarecrow-like protein 13 n=1 Tax=Ipomoea triloba TaxID=35885 RepID=UPI00125E44DA|nr:scarecrow-like protein 13 [Ipomoea triloba]